MLHPRDHSSSRSPKEHLASFGCHFIRDTHRVHGSAPFRQPHAGEPRLDLPEIPVLFPGVPSPQASPPLQPLDRKVKMSHHNRPRGTKNLLQGDEPRGPRCHYAPCSPVTEVPQKQAGCTWTHRGGPPQCRKDPGLFQLCPHPWCSVDTYSALEEACKTEA